MENIPVLYVLFVLIGCLLALIAIWSRRTLVVRLGAVLGLVALVSVNYGALVNLLGRPQPVEGIITDTVEDDAIVLAASIEEGQAIYLWLRHPQRRQPRYYILDWDQDAAIALKKAMDQSARNNTTVMMNPHYESSLETDKEPLFYILPPERLPLKPPPEVFEYRNPNNAI